MSKTITMNIRMDEATRQDLKKFATHIGIPATSLVNASIRQMLRTGAVTFNSSLVPTPYLENIITEAEADYKTGRNIHGPFNSAEAMISDLEK